VFRGVPADHPTGLLTLANEYDEVAHHEDEAAVPEHYATI
jgi:hypothetical protein